MNDDFVCEQCDAEYQILHREQDDPTFCPFCGWQKMPDDDEDEEGTVWDDE